MPKRLPSIYGQMADFSADTTNEFDRARTGMATPFLSRVLDLSVARTNEIHNISGDFLYCDISTTGQAIIELNNQMDAAEAPITFAAGFGVECPFKQLKISNAAQAGAKLVLIYGAGDNKIIPSSSLLNVNSILQPVNINNVVSASCQYVNNYIATVAVGVSTAQVLAPASNPNGMIIRSFAHVNAPSTAGAGSLLVAAAQAPATMNGTNGQLLLSFTQTTANGTVMVNNDFDMNKKIPAGWGIWSVDQGYGSSAAANRTVMMSFELL